MATTVDFVHAYTAVNNLGLLLKMKPMLINSTIGCVATGVGIGGAAGSVPGAVIGGAVGTIVGIW